MEDKNHLIQGFSKKNRNEKIQIVAEKHKNPSEADLIYKSFHHQNSTTQRLLCLLYTSRCV